METHPKHPVFLNELPPPPPENGPLILELPSGPLRIDRKVVRAFDGLMDACQKAGMTRNQLFEFTATALGIEIEQRD